MASMPQTPTAQREGRLLVDLTLSPLSPIPRLINPDDLGGNGPLSTSEDPDIIRIGRELEAVKMVSALYFHCIYIVSLMYILCIYALTNNEFRQMLRNLSQANLPIQ